MSKLVKRLGDVREWIAAGNRGTVTEIGEALGIKRGTAYFYLRQLADADEAMVVETLPVLRHGWRKGNLREDVWGRYADEPAAPTRDIVAQALANRTPIERAWG